MVFFTFLLEIYFAATLASAGFLKIDDPTLFEKTLRQQRLLPGWMLKPTSRILPSIEIGLAFLLVFGILERVTLILVLLLFAGFLAVKAFLFLTKSDAGCGCTGRNAQQKVDGGSVMISSIQLLLVGVALGLAIWASSVSEIWRLIAGALFTGASLFLIGRVVRRHFLRYSAQVSYGMLEPAKDGISVGEEAPLFVAKDQYGKSVSLDDFRGRRCLLAFVAPGCPACPGALKALNRIGLQNREIEMLILGGYDYEANCSYAIEHQTTLPMLTPEAGTIDQAYRVRFFPLVFALNEEGTVIAKGIVNNLEHLQVIIEHAYQTPVALSSFLESQTLHTTV